MIRILVIDDDALISDVLETQLLQWGYEVDIAPNGKMGVEQYFEFKPDIVIMDQDMPILDGLSASREIMSRDPFARIILLTAYLDTYLVDCAKLIGIKHCLDKPIEVKKFQSVLQGVLVPNQIEKILIVDDEIGILEILEVYLMQKNYTFEKATTGLEALAVFDEFQPDLIFMDLRMPEMDGMTAAKEISGRYPSQRIIFLTAFADEEVQEEIKMHKGWFLVDKPFDFHKIMDAIQKASFI